MRVLKLGVGLCRIGLLVFSSNHELVRSRRTEILVSFLFTRDFHIFHMLISNNFQRTKFAFNIILYFFIFLRIPIVAIVASNVAIYIIFAYSWIFIIVANIHSEKFLSDFPLCFSSIYAYLYSLFLFCDFQRCGRKNRKPRESLFTKRRCHIRKSYILVWLTWAKLLLTGGV